MHCLKNLQLNVIYLYFSIIYASQSNDLQFTIFNDFPHRPIQCISCNVCVSCVLCCSIRTIFFWKSYYSHEQWSEDRMINYKQLLTEFGSEMVKTFDLSVKIMFFSFSPKPRSSFFLCQIPLTSVILLPVGPIGYQLKCFWQYERVRVFFFKMK